MPGLVAAPPEGDFKPDSSGAVLSPGIYARAGCRLDRAFRTSPLRALLPVVLHQLLHHGRVRQGGDVSELVVLAGGDLAQDTPHDLARAGLGQAGDDLDTVRGREGADRLAHLLLEGA